jgi:hypothetical protein
VRSGGRRGRRFVRGSMARAAEARPRCSRGACGRRPLCAHHPDVPRRDDRRRRVLARRPVRSSLRAARGGRGPGARGAPHRPRGAADSVGAERSLPERGERALDCVRDANRCGDHCADNRLRAGSRSAGVDRGAAVEPPGDRALSLDRCPHRRRSSQHRPGRSLVPRPVGMARGLRGAGGSLRDARRRAFGRRAGARAAGRAPVAVSNDGAGPGGGTRGGSRGDDELRDTIAVGRRLRIGVEHRGALARRGATLFRGPVDGAHVRRRRRRLRPRELSGCEPAAGRAPLADLDGATVGTP